MSMRRSFEVSDYCFSIRHLLGVLMKAKGITQSGCIKYAIAKTIISEKDIDKETIQRAKDELDDLNWDITQEQITRKTKKVYVFSNLERKVTDMLIKKIPVNNIKTTIREQLKLLAHTPKEVIEEEKERFVLFTNLMKPTNTQLKEMSVYVNNLKDDGMDNHHLTMIMNKGLPSFPDTYKLIYNGDNPIDARIRKEKQDKTALMINAKEKAIEKKANTNLTTIQPKNKTAVEVCEERIKAKQEQEDKPELKDLLRDRITKERQQNPEYLKGLKNV